MAARSSLYGRSQIVLGDRTDHGGVVISGSDTNSWYGIPVARKTDKVFCPRCKPHIFEIAEGLAACTDTDAALPMAVEGHSTTCGAVLVAEGVSSSMLDHALQFLNRNGFDDHYVLRDGAGQPMCNTYYGCKMPDGSIQYGTTDGSGRTAMVLTGSQAEQVIIYVAG